MTVSTRTAGVRMSSAIVYGQLEASDVPVRHNRIVSTRILLIRHAVIDTASRLCGSYDVPLSDAGRQQLQSLGRKHPSRPAPDALYASSLTRARAVGAELGRVWKLEPQIVEWAREIHCGDVEGMPLAELQRRFPAVWARNQEQCDDTFAWPGGETYAEFRARILAGIKATAVAHPGRRVAVVTHAGVISQIVGSILRRPPAVWAADRPEPFTATEITCENGAPAAVLTYNEANWY